MTEKINVKADWNDDNRRYFINAMVRETEHGNFVDTGFKKSEWKNIVDDLNAASGKQFNKQHLDDLLVIRHHQYLMIFIIDAVLEFDFGEHLGQGLLLIVSLAKVLADKTSDLKVRQSCPPQGNLRLVEDL